MKTMEFNPAHLATEKEKVMNAEVVEFDARNWYNRCHEMAVEYPSPENTAKEVAARADWDAALRKLAEQEALINAELAEFDARNWYDRCHELAVYQPSAKHTAQEAAAKADWDAALRNLEGLK